MTQKRKRELNSLDMAINFKKSSCIRIGHRMDAPCATISSSAGSTIIACGPVCDNWPYSAVLCFGHC